MQPAQTTTKIVDVEMRSTQTPTEIVGLEMQPARTMGEIVDVGMQSTPSQKNHPPFSILVPPTSGWPPIPAHNVSVSPTSGRLSIPTQNFVGPKSSMPKEPSKLRFSVQPESTVSPALVPESRMIQMSPEVNFAPSASVPTFMVTPSIPAQGVLSTSGSHSASIPKIDLGSTVGAQQLPAFAFASPTRSTVDNSGVRGEVRSAVKTTLPVYDITL